MAASNVEEARPSASATRKLFVGNISYRITARELRQFFSEFGPVRHCQIVKDHRKGWSRGIGFVTFESSETAAKALTASPDDLVLDGRTLHLAAADIPKKVKLAQGGFVESPEDNSPASEEDGLDGEWQTGSSVRFPPGSTELSSEQSCGSPDEVRGGSGLVDHEGYRLELNDDLWLIIFSTLDIRDRVALEGVCKRWRRLAILSWKSLKRLSFENMFKSIFRAGKHVLTDKLLHMFLKRCGAGLLSLDLSTAPPYHLTEYSLDLVGQYCCSLRHLNLAHMSVTRVALRTMAQRLTQLQSVDLQHSKGVGEKALWWLLNSLKALEYLNVADNKRITGQFFYQAGGTLKEVVLNDCSQLTDEGVSFLCQRSPELEVLHVSRCGCLSGRAVASITKNCQKLRKLHFVSDSPQNIDTRDLLQLGSLHQLTELVLDRHGAVTDEVMSKIGRNCPKLRYLSCEACHSISDAGTRHLESCPDLQHIVLSYCDKFTDAGLQHLGATHDGLERVILRACPLINDNAVVQLCLSCPKLATLDISGCVSVTDKVLPPLLEFLSFSLPEGRPQLSVSLGGTSIHAEKAVQFARVTGTQVSLHDLSLSYLAADYDPYMNLAPFTEEEEDWDQDNFPPTTLTVGQPGGAEVHRVELAGEYEDDETEVELDDFLMGDDPAMYSDEFSGPEDEF